MKKWVCKICGYVHEGSEPPVTCPVCNAPASKFEVQAEDNTWAAEHVVGIAKDAPEDIINDLRMNYEGECREIGRASCRERV